MKSTDEYRTPEWLGLAMARAADVTQFELDPFCSLGFSGIPAKRRITREQNAFKMDWGRPASVGFNIPFSQATRALARINELTPKWSPCVGIVRLDPSTQWWSRGVRGHFECAAMFHRVQFYDTEGRKTQGSPRSGIAVVARNVDFRRFRISMELSIRDIIRYDRGKEFAQQEILDKTPWVVAELRKDHWDAE